MHSKVVCSLISVAIFFAAFAVTAQEKRAAVVMPKPKPGSTMPFPRLAVDGRLRMVYVEQTDTASTVRYREMFGAAPIESAISAPNDKLTHFGESPPVLEVMRDGTIYVLYTVRAPAGPGADYPSELRLTSSKDDGRIWAPYRVMGDPDVRVYRGCAAMREDGKGRLIMTWLEGHPGSPAIGAKLAIMKDEKIDYSWIDETTCECCATELALAADGSMWFAYRDKDESNVRDMVFMRMAPGADRFEAPTPISRDKWVVRGCPESGARFAFDGPSTAWVTWFTGTPRAIYVSHTNVASPEFAPRETVQAMDEHYTGMAHPAIGTLPDGRLLLANQCTKDGIQHVEVRVRNGDAWSEPFALTGSGEFPRIVSNGKKTYLVYTAIGENDKSVVVRDAVEIVGAK